MIIFNSFFNFCVVSDLVDFCNFICYSVCSSENISIIICGGMVGVVGIISGFAMKGVKKAIKVGGTGAAIASTTKVIVDVVSDLVKGSGGQSQSGSKGQGSGDTGKSGNTGQSGGNTGQSGNSGSASK